MLLLTKTEFGAKKPGQMTRYAKDGVKKDLGEF